jgi:diguanylate cyclase (GGDEF)-like protein
MYSLDQLLRDHQPFLMILCAESNPSLDFHPAAVAKLAGEYGIPLALRVDVQDRQAIRQALAVTACTVINARQDDQLRQTVREYLARWEAAAGVTNVHDQMEELQKLNQLLLRSAGEAISYIHEGLHIRANDSYLDCLGIADAESLLGLSVLELLQGEQEDLRQVFRDMARGAFPAQPLAVIVEPPHGVSFTATVAFAPIRLEGEECVQMILRTSDSAMQSPRKHDTPDHTDPLTGLLHREHFLPQLSGYLEDMEHRAAASAVMYLQPDGFAEYQNVLGYLDADRFLADFAQLVRDCLDTTDIACRFADQQFAVLLRRGTPGDIDAVGQRLLKAAGQHRLEIGHHLLETSCSIGMVTLGPMVSSADQVLAQAREACTEAMESGNCLVRHKPNLSMVAADDTSHQWAERLRIALDHGSFYSLQQPVVNLDGESDGLHEMLSFLREESGDVPQGEYLEAADACHLGPEIDRTLIPGLLSSFAENPGVKRFVTRLSRGSLLDAGFAGWLEQQLTAQGIAGPTLVLEVTTEDAVANQACAIRLADDLHRIGCGLALCDFADDVRHLRLLGSLDITLVKLRQDLIDQLAGKPKSREAVRQLVKTITRAGAEVLAAGVNDAPHIAALWQVGIKRVVGDFLEDKSGVAAS